MAGPMDRGIGSQPQQSTAGGTMGAVTEKAQQLASTATQKAQDAWEATRESTQQVASRVADTAGDAWENARWFMSRYPFATLFIGLGLGFLLVQAFRGFGESNDLRRTFRF